MATRTRQLALTSIAVVAAVAGWLGVVLARWDRADGVARAVLVVAFIAAGYRAWLAPTRDSRDWWFGFALFGLFHILSPSTGPGKPLMAVGVDRLAELALGGGWDENGNATDDSDGRRATSTRLGKSIDTISVTSWGEPSLVFHHYVRGVTKRFASLVFGLIGGMVAMSLGRTANAVAEGSTVGARVPRLGLAAMILVATMAALTFVLDSQPDLVQKGWFTEAPGSLAAHYALRQTEALLVLFAALEARFGDWAARPWWTGFALFGGTYLVMIDTPLFDLLPSRWLKPWVQDGLHRFVADPGSLVVQVRGIIMFDDATQEFFRLEYSWAPLLGFLPAAWFGTIVARAFDRLSRRMAGASGGKGRRRSAIARMMAVVAIIGIFLAAARGTSEGWTAAVANGVVATLTFAALRAALERGQNRSWWFGFALIGWVDLLLWTTYAQQRSAVLFSTPWPPHEAIERLHLAAFERSTGDSVPSIFMSFSHKMGVVLETYTQSRAVVLMGACLPMACLGGMMARFLDRRRSANAGELACTADVSLRRP